MVAANMEERTPDQTSNVKCARARSLLDKIALIRTLITYRMPSDHSPTGPEPSHKSGAAERDCHCTVSMEQKCIIQIKQGVEEECKWRPTQQELSHGRPKQEQEATSVPGAASHPFSTTTRLSQAFETDARYEPQRSEAYQQAPTRSHTSLPPTLIPSKQGRTAGSGVGLLVTIQDPLQMAHNTERSSVQRG